MPVLSTIPYPSIQEICDLWRSLVLDTFTGATGTVGEGRTATNDAPFTLPFLNQALRELQRKLDNNGVGTFTKDNFILNSITPVPNVDPGSPCFISYTGYWDGTNNNQNPVLPTDLLVPLQVWERPVNTVLPYNPMTQLMSLPSQTQQNYNGAWAWFTDRIYFPGSTQELQFRLRYKAKIFSTVSVQPSDFPTTYIQCVDSQDAIALTMAYNYQNARGGGAGAQLTQDKDKAVSLMIGRQVRAQAEIPFNREPWGGESDISSPSGNADGW